MEEYTIEEVKKDLKSYIFDKQLIEEKEKEIEDYRTKATSCTSELNDMPKGSRTIYDKLAEYAAIIVDLQNEKYQDLILLEKKKQEIETNINNIEQPYRNILYFKYILGKNLTDIAYKSRYEYKHVCKLHGIALKKYRDLKNTTKHDKKG